MDAEWEPSADPNWLDDVDWLELETEARRMDWGEALGQELLRSAGRFTMDGIGVFTFRPNAARPADGPGNIEFASEDGLTRAVFEFGVPWREIPPGSLRLFALFRTARGKESVELPGLGTMVVRKRTLGGETRSLLILRADRALRAQLTASGVPRLPVTPEELGLG